jgi:hypothetical protein
MYKINRNKKIYFLDLDCFNLTLNKNFIISTENILIFRIFHFDKWRFLMLRCCVSRLGRIRFRIPNVSRILGSVFTPDNVEVFKID